MISLRELPVKDKLDKSASGISLHGKNSPRGSRKSSVTGSKKGTLPQEEDNRLTWFEDRVCASLAVSSDDFSYMLQKKDSKTILNNFLEDAVNAKIFFFTVPGQDDRHQLQNLKCSSVAPGVNYAFTKCVCFLKQHESKVPFHDAGNDILTIEICVGTPQSLFHMLRDALFPMLSLQSNMKGLTSSAAKEFGFACEEFTCALEILCGKICGKILLPLPMSFANSEIPEVIKQKDSSVLTKQREAVRKLEACILSWTKQIRICLSKDPDDVGRSTDTPCPSSELNFWSARSLELQNILTQLRQETTRRALSILQSCGSSYYDSLMVCIQSVEQSAVEARSNTRYLEVLRPHIRLLEDYSVLFDTSDVEPPRQSQWLMCLKVVFHLLSLISQHSPFYNTPLRLSLMIRQLANVTIQRSCHFILNGMGNEVILKDCTGTVLRLSKSLQICRCLKSTFLKYEFQSKMGTGSGAWQIAHTVLFSRLDLHIERCEDLFFAAKSAAVLEGLRDIQIGSTHGHKATAECNKIYRDSKIALATLIGVEYDIMSIADSSFEIDFSVFGQSRKSIDLRLLRILQQVSEDCTCIQQVCELLSIFGPLAEGSDVLCKYIGYIVMNAVKMYQAEVKLIQDFFVSGSIYETPPGTYFKEMPPRARNMLWVRAIQDRIEVPLRQMQRLRSPLLKAETFSSMLREFSKISKALKEYEENILQNLFAQGQKVVTAEVMKRFLLQLSANNILAVNLDSRLEELFRECAVLKCMGYSLPEAIDKFCEKSKAVKMYSGQLTTISKFYNNIFESVEDEAVWPLMKDKLTSLREMLNPSLKSITWKSHGIEKFIVHYNQALQENFTIICGIRGKIKEIREILHECGEHRLFKRNYQKTCLMEEFQETHKRHVVNRLSLITAGFNNIQTNIMDIMIMLGANWTMQEWNTYVKYVWDVVRDWLKPFIVKELQHLLGHLQQNTKLDASVTMFAPYPLIDVTLMLINAKVTFQPPITSDSGQRTITSMANMWIDDITNVISLADRCISDAKFHDMIKDVVVVQVVDSIKSALIGLKSACFHFSSRFSSFSFLWEGELKQFFNKSLKSAILDLKKGYPDLAYFEKKMGEIDRLRSLLSNIEDIISIWWLRVDARLLKQSIKNFLKEWELMHTKFLSSFFCERLDSIFSFIRKTRDDLLIASDLHMLDDEHLLAFLKSNRNVQLERVFIESSFDPLAEIATFLELHAVPLESQQAESLSNLIPSWAELQKFSLQVKEKHSSFISTAVEKLKVRAAKLHTQEMTFRSSLENAVFLTLPGGEVDHLDKAYNGIAESCRQLRDIESEICKISELEMLLEHDCGLKLPSVSEIWAFLVAVKALWDLISLVNGTLADWAEMLWSNIAVNTCSQQINEFIDFVDLLPRFLKEKTNAPLERLKGLMNSVEKTFPVLERMQGPQIRPRHWKQVTTLLATPVNFSEQIKFAEILRMDLPSIADEVTEIAKCADKEVSIETELVAIESRWSKKEVNFCPHESMQTMVLSMENVASIFEDLHEEHITLRKLQLRNVSFFAEAITGWQKRLATFEILLKFMTELQELWVKMHFVYGHNRHVRSMLPQQSQDFEVTDQEVVNLMLAIRKRRLAVDSCSEPALISQIEKHFLSLSKYEVALTDWLDSNRQSYPRFYFLSDPELLFILSEGTVSPKKFLHYLPKIVVGVQSLLFASRTTASGKEVQGMVGAHDETLIFENEIAFPRDVILENWFAELTSQMRLTVQASLFESVSASSGSQSLLTWASQHCGQVTILACNVLRTAAIEECLDRDQHAAFEKYRAKLGYNLEELSKHLRTFNANILKRTNLSELLVSELYGYDVVEYLYLNNIHNRNDFAWQSQVHYRLRQSTTPSSAERFVSKCIFQIGGTMIDYGFEYLNRQAAFVITASTLRSFLSFANAFRSHEIVGVPVTMLGNSRQSIGRTETCRHISYCAGRALFVYNCSAGMHPKSVIAAMCGLTQSGVYGSFESFDSVRTEVLSCFITVVASITHAFRTGKSCIVNGQDVRPEKGFSCFISWVTETSDFLKLTPHIKNLVRPVCIQIPDLLTIAEVLLCSEGFLMYKTLAPALVSLVLIEQNYVGAISFTGSCLRLLVWSIRSAGRERRIHADLNEELVIVNKLTPAFMARCPTSDSSLISTFFEHFFHEQSRRRTTVHIHSAVSAMHLQPEETFIIEVSRLREVLEQCSAVLIIGDSGVGKSAVWRALAKLGWNGQGESVIKIDWQAMDPSSVPADLLVGKINMDTHAWIPGVISNLARAFASKHKTDMQWIVLDGDVTPDWISLLCCTFDEDHALRLDCGERIDWNCNMKIIIETCTLMHASPSAVFKCGIQYISPTRSSAFMMVRSWLQKLQRHASSLEFGHLFDAHLEKILKLVKNADIHYSIPFSEIACCSSMLRIMDGLILASAAVGRLDSNAHKMIFAFAAIWGFGGAVSADGPINSKRKFHEAWESTFDLFGTSQTSKAETIFDYGYDLVSLQLQSWNDMILPMKRVGAKSVQDIIVNIPSQVCISRILSIHTPVQHPVLVIGKSGVGKTSVVTEFLESMAPPYTSVRLPLHFYADASFLQQMMNRYLSKQAGKVIGPYGSNRMIFFVDDISITCPNPYNVRSVCSLLRQHIEYGVWYDLESMQPKELIDVQYVSAASISHHHPALSSRTLRHFTTIEHPSPDFRSLQSICGSIIWSILQKFNSECRLCSDCISSSSAFIHLQYTGRFSGPMVPAQYNVTLHNLKGLLKALSQATPDFYNSKQSLLSLWIFDLRRVYEDRLVNTADRLLFEEILREGLQKCIDVHDILSDPHILSTLHSMDPSTAALTPESSLERFRSYVQERSQFYNNGLFPFIDLELSEDAMGKLVRMVRMLKSADNFILCGASGLRQENLVKLAAFCCGISVMRPSVHEPYTLVSFQCDIEKAMQRTGRDKQEVIFMIRDYEILDDQFMVYVHAWMQAASGWWDLETKEADRYAFRLFNPQASSGFSDSASPNEMVKTASERWEEFLSTVNRNLRLGLCLQQQAVERLSRKFSEIISRFNMLYFDELDGNTLFFIANNIINAQEELTDAKLGYAVAHHTTFVHNSAKEIHSSILTECQGQPTCLISITQFLDFLKMFPILLRERKKQLQDKIDQISSSSSKFAQVEQALAKVKRNRHEWESALAIQENVVANLLTSIGAKTKELEDLKGRSRIDEVSRQKAAAELYNAQIRLDQILERADPLSIAIARILKDLNKAELNEIKSFTNPPSTVAIVFTAVLILQSKSGLSTTDVSWPFAKRALGSIERFIFDLTKIDKENVARENIDALQTIISRSEFTPESVRRVSSVTAELCEFVLAIVEYNNIFVSDMKPARAQIATLDQNLKNAIRREQHNSLLLEELQNALQNFHEELDKESRKKHKMSKLHIQALASLEQSGSFVHNYILFQKETNPQLVAELEVKVRGSCGDSLSAAALLIYGGLLSEDQRKGFIHIRCRRDLATKRIPTSDCEVIDVIADLVQICCWYKEGLPHPNFSLSSKWAAENCAIALKAPRCSIFVDPDYQADIWAQCLQQQNKAKVVPYNAAEYRNIVSECIKNGLTVIIKGLPVEADFWTFSLMKKETLRKGKGNYITIGNETMECNHTFKTFFLFNGSEMDFPPHISAVATKIDFQVRSHSLQDHMLVLLFAARQPQLDLQRVQALQSIIDSTNKMNEIEKALSFRLSDLDGCLEDSQKLVEISESMQQIVKERDEAARLSGDLESLSLAALIYAEHARHLCFLWNCARTLQRIDSANVFSLRVSSSVLFHALRWKIAIQFPDVKESLELWEFPSKVRSPHEYDWEEQALHQSSEELERGASDQLSKYFDAEVFLKVAKTVLLEHILSGLFTKDRHVFLSHIYFEELIFKEKLTRSCYLVLVEKQKPSPLVSTDTSSCWIPPAAQQTVSRLAKEIPKFVLLKDVLETADFKSWYDTDEPEQSKPRCSIDFTDTEFLFLIRALRPDRISFAISKYISIDWFSSKSSNGTGTEKLMSALELADNLVHNNLALKRVFWAQVQPILMICNDDEYNIEDELRALLRARCCDSREILFKTSSSNNLHLFEEISDACSKGEWILIKDLDQRSCNMQKFDDFLGELVEPQAIGSSGGTWTSTEVQLVGKCVEVHRDFRIFISSQSHAHLPNGILCRTMKLSLEIPSSLKAKVAFYVQISAKTLTDALASSTVTYTNNAQGNWNSKFARLHAVLVYLSHLHTFVFSQSPLAVSDLFRVYEDLHFLSKFFNKTVSNCAESENKMDMVLRVTSIYHGKLSDFIDFNFLYNIINRAFQDIADRKAGDPPAGSPQRGSVQDLCKDETNWEDAVRQTPKDPWFDDILVLQGRKEASLILSSNLDEIKQIIEETLEYIDLRPLDLSMLQTEMQKPPDNFPVIHNLLNECNILNSLFSTVWKDLKEMDNVLLQNSGNAQDPKVVLRSADCFLNGRIPDTWIAQRYQCGRSFAAWIRDLRRSRDQVWKHCAFVFNDVVHDFKSYRLSGGFLAFRHGFLRFGWVDCAGFNAFFHLFYSYLRGVLVLHEIEVLLLASKIDVFSLCRKHKVAFEKVCLAALMPESNELDLAKLSTDADEDLVTFSGVYVAGARWSPARRRFEALTLFENSFGATLLPPLTIKLLTFHDRGSDILSLENCPIRIFKQRHTPGPVLKTPVSLLWENNKDDPPREWKLSPIYRMSGRIKTVSPGFDGYIGELALEWDASTNIHLASKKDSEADLSESPRVDFDESDTHSKVDRVLQHVTLVLHPGEAS